MHDFDRPSMQPEHLCCLVATLPPADRWAGKCVYGSALPDNLSSGRVSGLKARGGFEVDIQWVNQKFTRHTIKSNIGGNCRIRLYDKIKLQSKSELAAATGDNPNPFYKTPAVKDPIVSPLAKLKEVKIRPSVVYDLKTEPGKSDGFAGK